MAPLQVTVYPKGSMTPGPPAGGNDPYADFADAPAAPAAPKAAAADPYADFSDTAPEVKPTKEHTPAESAGRGLVDSLTFGSYPAIAGAIGAGQTPEEREESRRGYESGHWPSAASELGALVKGLGKLGYEHLIAPALGVKHGDEATQEYRTTRDEARREQESAEEQNPKSYIAGEIGGALAAPLGGAAKAATAAGRVFGAARAGGIAGGVGGLGGGLSRGDDLPDLAKDVGMGGAAGAAVGGTGGAAVEGGAKLIRRGRDLIQGLTNPEAVASRNVRREMLDASRTNQLGIDRDIVDAARDTGMPIHNIDIGGQRTRDQGRALANLSPEAADKLETAMAERAADRGERMSDRIHGLFGGRLDAGEDQLLLQDAGRRINSGAYKKAHIAGDRPIQPPETLLGAPAVRDAMKAAIERGQNRASSEGQGAFNPGVRVTADGRIEFTKGKSGVPTYPNLQFWDYVQRELRDAADTAARKGANEESSAIGSLRRQLNKFLDDEVPEFQQARRGAAAFFGAEDALDAGRKFISQNADPREARRALAAMSPPERELFARGFADELSQALLDKDSWGIVKKAFTTPRAREKIEIALGPIRAREIEAMTRAEMAARKTEEAILGNSTTAKQLSGKDRLLRQGLAVGGHGAAGAIGTFELLKEGDYSAKDIIMGALVVGSLRGGAHKIDDKVARKMAELLASRNPADVLKGARIVARSPQLFEALRRGTEAGSRVTAKELGPAGVGASFVAIYDHVMSEEGDGDHHHGHHSDPAVADQPNP